MKRDFIHSPAFRLIAWILAAVILVGVVAFVVIKHREQQAKLNELAEQRKALEDQINELLREEERLRSNMEFVKSLEGLLLYARDYLGYIDPGDIRIEDGK